jgi:putative hydrolase of the HAD superfamily
MKKIIIFDFTRTLYDPVARQLVLGALEVVKTLHERGYTLVLVSHDEGNRETLIGKLGLKKYFADICIVKEKNPAVFSHVLEKNDADTANSFVIGDRIKKEILFGNLCGVKTIWFCNGKFATEIPTNDNEKPTHVIQSLTEVLTIIL